MRPALLVFAWAASFPGAAVAQTGVAKKAPAAASATPRGFKVELEQGGKPVVVKDHEATLARAPFAVLVTSPDQNGVYVSVSFGASLYEDAQTGRPFGKRFRTTIVGAEGNANGDQEVFVSGPADEMLNYWFYGPKDAIRFDEAIPMGAGYRGRRTIARLFFSAEKVVEMTKAPRKALHLVFVRGKEGKAGDYAIVEEQREFLKLYLDTISDGAKEAARGYFMALGDTSKPAAERNAALQAFAKMGPDAISAIDAISAEARLKAHEASAVGDIRTLISAEAAYASMNGGLFDTPGCLVTPGPCLGRKAPSSAFLASEPEGSRNGYTRRFVAGPAPKADEIKRLKASPSSLRSFAYVGVPDLPGESGERAFCGDSTGRVCFMADGSAPVVKNGACDASCPSLP
jgi:hypothetical protein